MNRVVYISYGMGGAAIETWNTGLRQLITRCRDIGIDTRKSPYQWSDVNLIAADANEQPSGTLIALGGASLGDDEASDAARRIQKAIKYLFGFQDSTYGVQVGVPANVRYADNIYNPNWLETFGLGSGKWFLAPNNKVTVLRNIPIRAPHPDDWGVAQDIVFSRIHSFLGDLHGAGSSS